MDINGEPSFQPILGPQPCSGQVPPGRSVTFQMKKLGPPWEGSTVWPEQNPRLGPELGAVLARGMSPGPAPASRMRTPRPHPLNASVSPF